MRLMFLRNSEDDLAESVTGLNILVSFGQVFKQIWINLGHAVGNHALIDQIGHFLQDLAVFFLIVPLT